MSGIGNDEKYQEIDSLISSWADLPFTREVDLTAHKRDIEIIYDDFVKISSGVPCVRKTIRVGRVNSDPRGYFDALAKYALETDDAVVRNILLLRPMNTTDRF